MKTEVIAFKNLPARFPIYSTITAWLLLDRLKVPQWVWGVVGTIFVIGWIFCIYGVIAQKQVDVIQKVSKP